MPKCFIITPYGEKKDASGKTINFDETFNALIEKVIRECGVEAVPSDQDLAPKLTVRLASAFGHNVCFGSLTDIGQPIRDVRLAPESGHVFSIAIHGRSIFEAGSAPRQGGFPARTPALPASSLLLPCFSDRKDVAGGLQLSEITHYFYRLSCG